MLHNQMINKWCNFASETSFSLKVLLTYLIDTNKKEVRQIYKNKAPFNESILQEDQRMKSLDLS